MDHFTYRAGQLHAEDVPLDRIAEAVGTPFYCYSTATLERHYRVFTEALDSLDHLICFAVKANSNLAVIATLARLGAGADVVSGGELKRALIAGVPPERIVFSGVGKTPDEMAAALDAGIYQFNVESEPELQALNDIAVGRGQRAPIAFRINPDVDARTHAKISTGKSENKFGIPWTRARDVYARARQMPGIDVVGLDMHIGSQLTDLEPFRAAFARVVDLVDALRGDGHNIGRLDLGGGLGIPYQPDRPAPPHPREYGAAIAEAVADVGCRIIVEPGRLIAGNAGILVSRVLYLKQGEARTFVVVDAAMNDLMRPAVYDAYHDIVPVAQAQAVLDQTVDYVGPVCESSDRFAKDRAAPALKPGDLVAIKSAGAYGAVMASTYNTRPLVPEILARGADFAVIRRRLEVDDIIAMDQVPAWLTD